MRLNRSLCAALLVVSSAGCHAAGPPASAAGGSCDLTTVGPLVGYSYQTMPQPLAAGGPLSDGTYDLVAMVDHRAVTGPWSTNEAPALRMAFRFVTDERSANHAEGSLVSAMDVPPSHYCEGGRFATVERELRGLRGSDHELSSAAYSATSDGLMLLFPHATFVFRRRS